MKISTIILATTMAIISSCAFAAEGDAGQRVGDGCHLFWGQIRFAEHHW
jgi:hypothetical protein